MSIGAVHALRASGAVHDVDVPALQRALWAAGAWLPEVPEAGPIR